MPEPIEVNLSFDPGTLTELKNEDQTPFFSEDQVGRLKGFDKFKGERGQAQLVKSHMELESMRGLADKTLSELKREKETFESETATKFEKHLAPLKENATDEEKTDHQLSLKKFFGAPEKVEDYNVIKMPEGVAIDEEAMTDLKEWAFKSHKSVADTEELLGIQLAMVKRQQEVFDDSQNEDARTTEKILTKLWKGKEAYVEKTEHILRTLRQFVNPDWRKTEEAMDEPWQKFKKDVYFSGIANNDSLMAMLGEAIDKGVGRAEGKTHIEMHGSVPVVTKSKDKTWEDYNPGVPEP